MAYSYAGKGKEKASLTTDIRFTLWCMIFQRGIFQDPSPGCINTVDHTVVKKSSPFHLKSAVFHLTTTTVKVLCPLMQFPSWGEYIGPYLSFMDCTFGKETRPHRWSTTFQIFHVIKNKLKKKKKARMENLILNETSIFSLLHQSVSCLLQRSSSALRSKHLLAVL